MTQLTAEDFALILGRTIMTPHGKATLNKIKLSGLQLATVNDQLGVRERLYWVGECKPICREMDQITAEDVQNRRMIGGSPESRVIWALRNGYDILGWIDDGLAIQEEV